MVNLYVVGVGDGVSRWWWWGSCGGAPLGGGELVGDGELVQCGGGRVIE